MQAPQPPYYLQVKLPGAETSEFQLTSVLTGFQREFMSAYVAASSDPANYGKLTVLRLAHVDADARARHKCNSCSAPPRRSAAW